MSPSFNKVEHGVDEVMICGHLASTFMGCLLPLIRALTHGLHNVIFTLLAGVLFNDLEELSVLGLKDIYLSVKLSEFFLFLISRLLS